MPEIKVRFAPSPTGFVHVGSLRTALYNYIFAKHNSGKIVLRIEDTDQSRYVEGAIENLLDTMKWSGITYDEGPEVGGPAGPYKQSERLDIYKEKINLLLEKGHAYPCFCTAERLEQLREKRASRNESQGMYDKKCASIKSEDAKERMKSESHTIRMRVPQHGDTVIPDAIRGDVSFHNNLIDDQVLMKSDGYPTYHLANVVDDYLMGITHVIRGEEWLPSTPKHVLLYSFFEWKMPQFAHLPLLLNADRSKLSKRQGDVAVEDYRKKGILPEALLNFVALLGWRPGEDDQEIFDIKEMVSLFTLDRVNKSGAVFDMAKLEWMNGQYIRSIHEEEYLNRAMEWFGENRSAMEPSEINKKILLSVRERINTFSELELKTAFFYQDKINYYSESAKEWLKNPQSKTLFETMLQEIENANEINLDSFKQIMKNVQTNSGVKGKELWMPVRSAMTGMTEGPELPVVIEILGKQKVKTFLKQAINM